MATRDEMLATIDRAYGARREGDNAALADFLAPGATYRMNARESLPADLGLDSPEAGPAIGKLISLFEFKTVERGDSFVDGNKAAVRLRVTVAAPDGSETPTEFFDVWTFDRDGLVTSIEQFVDTALIAETSKPKR